MGIVGTILSSDESLALAHHIAKAATCLDDLQAAPVDGATYIRCCRAAKDHVKTLHDIATQLAGTRVDEVYYPDDQPDLMEGICCATTTSR